ncbi:MAG TPA: hypothetical protein VFA80_03795 [Xanthobacteraceae bacterium]|jgi:hypothetical protein|nr:hypothetical protein [Xanthobacteraceae bacterium]
MTMKKLVAATALIAGVTLGTASASFAQSIYYGGPYGYEYGYNGYDGYYGYRGSAPDWMRGGPGPRVQAGSGMGVGGVR